ncbi:MAG: GntR family transcriptional regulator [Rhodospirillaceae bacterium]
MATRAQDRTKADDVTQAIATDIQTGLLPPGTWLKQIDLQERYGCTRLDVRRALDNLVLKRFVQHEQHRGYYVFRLEEPRVRENKQIRLILESAAAEGVASRAAADDIARLEKRAAAFADAVRNGTLLSQFETNNAFHREFYGLCGNSELATLIGEFRSRGPAAPLTQWKSFARLEKSAAEHFEMIEAIKRRDISALKACIERHLKQS